MLCPDGRAHRHLESARRPVAGALMARVPPGSSDSQPGWRIAIDKSRRALVVWGLLILFVIYTILQNIGFGAATSVSGSPALVQCEGFTGIGHRGGECASWGADVLVSDIPSGYSMKQVTRLEIKRSLFGLIDHCTAEFSFDDSVVTEREIECR
jgi:hypothetical protein